MDAFRRRVPSARVEETQDKYGHRAFKVTYADGFEYAVTMDGSVIEIVLGKATAADLRKNVPRLERDVFGTAKDAGLVPHAFRGGGHVHIGLQSAFGDDVLLFRNFVVDYFNRPELALHGLRDRASGEALHLASLPEKLRDAFRKIVDEFDADYRAGKKWSIRDLAERIDSEVYGEAERMGLARNRRVFALNFDNIFTQRDPAKQTLEIRAIRPPGTADAHVSIVELFQGRLETLRGQTALIPWTNPSATMAPEEAALRLERYARDSGRAPTVWKAIVPPSAPVAGCIVELAI
jgi:hypothetical protein